MKLAALGLNKTYLKRQFYLWFGDRLKDKDEWAGRVKELLERRGQEYDRHELLDIIEVLAPAHYEAVIEWPEDYRPLEVWQAARRMNKYDNLRALLH